MTLTPPGPDDASFKADTSPLPEIYGTSEQLLRSAWERHDTYSKNASNAQSRFLYLRRILAYLGVLIVVLAVAQPLVLNRYGDTIRNLPLLSLFGPAKDLASLNLLLILLPITITGLRGFSVKFDRGNSWVLLRGNAEALKMEIFYYRTRVKQYSQNRSQALAEKLQLLSERVKGSAVHQTAFNPYEEQAPSRIEKGLVWVALQQVLSWCSRIIQGIWGFLFRFKEVTVPATDSTGSPPLSKEERLYQQRYPDLDPDGYIYHRLEDQFNWYRRKAKGYDRQYQVVQSSVYIFGGLGTLLAAIGFQSWVAVTAALTAALVNYLEYRRVEVTLVGYNQAADALYDIRTWWYSLSDAAKAKPANFEKLVVNTEETIRSEHNSWLQDMQDRLANLYGDGSDSKKAVIDDAPPAPNDLALEGRPLDSSPLLPPPGPGDETA